MQWQSEIEAGQLHISERAPKNCSEYVRKKTKIWLGNAWHVYKRHHYPAISAFKGIASNTEKVEQMASIFQRINTTTMTLATVHNACNQEISKLLKSAIPDQHSFITLPLGAIVGLYYPNSHSHSEAFFQAATGLDGTGRRVTSGPYFKVSDDQGNN